MTAPPERNARQVEAVTTKVVHVTALDARRVRFFARENAGAPIPPRAGFGNRFAGQLIFFQIGVALCARSRPMALALFRASFPRLPNHRFRAHPGH